jgi:hypothetical protein
VPGSRAVSLRESPPHYHPTSPSAQLTGQGLLPVSSQLSWAVRPCAKGLHCLSLCDLVRSQLRDRRIDCSSDGRGRRLRPWGPGAVAAMCSSVLRAGSPLREQVICAEHPRMESEPGMGAHSCIPSHEGGGDGEDDSVSPAQTKRETPSPK